jgi:geranylgeranyl diphosphate synthase, type II
MATQSMLVKEMLGEYGALTHTALQAFLRTQTERSDVYRIAADYPLRAGRSLRASFCIAAAKTFGATTQEAMRSAVSLELLHNAFLIHDDIEDESEERRGRPSLHQLHGVPAALNAGDALVTLSLRPLLGNRSSLGPRLAWRVIEEAERMVRESVEGQALELKWRQDNVWALTDSDYLIMTLKKTSWYTTIYPCRIGALIGSKDNLNLDAFVRFGFFLGSAFQIQDDLLNLVGDHSAYGKELSGDLREGKRTLMLIHALQHMRPPNKKRALELLALPRQRKQTGELSWLHAQLVELGSIEHARAVAHALAGAALHECERVFSHLPPSRDLAFIRALPYWVLERA